MTHSEENALARTVLFLHIPKTAGTTFNSILRLQYGYGVHTCPVVCSGDSRPGYRSLSLAQRRGHALVRGHFHYGLHEDIPGPSEYITFMRDPIARVVSYYHYVRTLNAPGHPTADKARAMGLHDFVTRRCTHDIENDQVRRIAGTEKADEEVTEEVFRKACENLRNFVFCGLTERFDESLLILAERLHWRLPPVYVRSNVIGRTQTPLPDATRDAIAENNLYDLRLYEQAKQQMGMAVAANPHFEKKLRRFCGVNRLARPLVLAAMYVNRKIRSSFKTR